MKKPFLSFLALLLLLTLVTSAALAEDVTPAPTSPITHFHEIWNIPWGVEYEEFAALAKENSGVVFDFHFENETTTSYRALPEQNTTMFGYPVVINANFSGEPRQLTSILFEFLSRNDITEQSIASAMLVSLFSNLSDRYGAPTYAYFRAFIQAPDEKYHAFYFSLPFQGRTLDIEKMHSLTGMATKLPATYAFFDNVHLSYLSEGSEATHRVNFRIDAFSPAEKDYFIYLPETNVYPYEQYDAITSDPMPETPTPVPQLDVGL